MPKECEVIRRGSGTSTAVVCCIIAMGCATMRPEQEMGRATPWSGAAVEQRIRQYRTADVTLVLQGADGRPVQREAVVRMRRQKFLFGCNAHVLKPADRSEAQRRYQERLVDLVNFATLAFYWGVYEPQEGEYQAAEAHRTRQARWLIEHGICIKGHPLVWRQVAPKWLPNDTDTVARRQWGRIGRDVRPFRGLIDTWDVVNEAADWHAPAILKTYDNGITALSLKLGRVELIKRAFREAKQANPDALLLLNDYRTGDDFEELVEECLAADPHLPVERHLFG